jgi:kynurenine formamidase
MAEEAWGIWGAQDEKGALNLIVTEVVKAAAALVKQGRVFSLAQPISERMMIPAHRPRASHFMNRDGGDYLAGARRPGGFQFAEDTIVLPLHVGTHLDGLCHAWCDHRLYNGFPESTLRSFGAERLGIEKLPPIVTRGVLLDFVAINGGPLADGTAIGRALVLEACNRSGTTLRKGDAVLLRTGWQEAHAASGTADFNTEPGIDVEAALFLAEAGVALVGADNYAIEVLPFPREQVFPVHQRLIRDFGVPLVEGLVLKELAKSGAAEFLFMAAPLPIVGGTGSPLTPVAVL